LIPPRSYWRRGYAATTTRELLIGRDGTTLVSEVEAVVLDAVCGQIGTLIGVHMAVFAQ